MTPPDTISSAENIISRARHLAWLVRKPTSRSTGRGTRRCATTYLGERCSGLDERRSRSDTLSLPHALPSIRLLPPFPQEVKNHEKIPEDCGHYYCGTRGNRYRNSLFH